VKRFYKKAAVVAEEQGFAVQLDGREIKTPEKRKNLSPTRRLAEAIRAEWMGQGDEIDLAGMLLTKLQNTAIDRVGPRRQDLIDELVQYAGTDLLCYRADFPADLAERQAKVWQPLLDWVADRHGIRLKVTRGIMHVEQDSKHLEKLRRLLDRIDDFHLAAFHNITTLCGSVSIALNVFGGHISVGQAWAAAQLDETYQAEQWGIDAESRIRQDNMKAELEAAAEFLKLCDAAA